MLTNFIKEKLSRPKLIPIEENNILNKPAIMDQLKMLTTEEMGLDDDYSGSDISDPFEEKKDTKEKLDQVVKRLSKLEKDYRLMKSFSDKYLKTMEEMRKEIKITNMAYEDISEVRETLKNAVPKSHISESLKEKIQELLNDTYLVGPDIADPEPVSNIGKKKEFDDLSGVWRLLDTSTGLLVSPPGYHVHRQMEPHWLNREGVPYKVMDNAKAKCEEWMNTRSDYSYNRN